MKKFLVPILACLLVFAASCENDSDSKSSSDNDGYLQEEMVVVGTHDNLDSVAQPGDIAKIYYTTDKKYAIIPTESTEIKTQREICSGFNDGGVLDIQTYKHCLIKFTKDQIDWSDKPYEVRPTEVWVYRSECLYPVSTNDCGCL